MEMSRPTPPWQQQSGYGYGCPPELDMQLEVGDDEEEQPHIPNSLSEWWRHMSGEPPLLQIVVPPPHLLQSQHIDHEQSSQVTAVSSIRRKQKHREDNAPTSPSPPKIVETPNNDSQQHSPQDSNNASTSPSSPKQMDADFYRCLQTGQPRGIKRMFRCHQGASRGLCQLTQQKNTPLHILAGRPDHVLDKKLIQVMLEECSELLTQKNASEDLPLHLAARAGCLCAVRSIVACAAGKEENIFEARNKDDETALNVALRLKHSKVAAWLIKAHPKAALCLNKKGESPLFVAAKLGELEHVTAMTRALADVGELRENDKHPVPGPDEIEQSVVVAAVIGGNPDVLATILKYYIINDTVTIPSGSSKRSPLSYAALEGNIQMVSYLMKRDDPNTSHKRDPNSTTGFFPIHLAAGRGHKEVVEKILHLLPDSIEVLTIDRTNILHMAANHGRDDLVRYILSTPGSDGLINAGDNRGNTPLHLAVIAKYPKAVNALTWDKRVMIDLVNDEGKTAQDLALRYDGGEEPSLKKELACLALIYAGAPPEKKTQRGKATKAFYTDMLHTLAVVAALVATVSFGASFTIPGGNSGTNPTLGTANFLNKPIFKVFMISDSIALYTSVLDVLVLILAMRGDAQLLHLSLNIAVPLLGISLAAMSVSFMSAAYLVISTLRWLGVVVWLLGSLFLLAAVAVFLLIFPALFGKNSFTRYLLYPLFRALLYISERENVRNDHFL